MAQRPLQVIATALLAVAAAGCMVERVTVVVEATRVEKLSNHLIFHKVIGSSNPERGVEILVFDISSDVDFKHYFADRQLQVRCVVDGAGDSFGFGPYYGDADLSSESLHSSDEPQIAPRKSDGRYAYTVYGFANLSATELVGSQFVFTPLESMTFSMLSCFIVGVTKAPVIFPRSNDIVVTREQFQALLKAYRAR